ncbi:MAG: hypothetical protein ACRDTC_11475 [Pseudonocardiaceae bacterium]
MTPTVFRAGAHTATVGAVITDISSLLGLLVALGVMVWRWRGNRNRPTRPARHRRDPAWPATLPVGTQVSARLGRHIQCGVVQLRGPRFPTGVFPVLLDDGVEWLVTARDVAVIEQPQEIS